MTRNRIDRILETKSFAFLFYGCRRITLGSPILANTPALLPLCTRFVSYCLPLAYTIRCFDWHSRTAWLISTRKSPTFGRVATFPRRSLPTPVPVLKPITYSADS